MKTNILRVQPESIDMNKIKKVAKILREGGLVAFPTETVYGLGANALDPTAVGKIFKVKGRPPDNPLIIHIGDKSELEKLATKIPQEVKTLIKNFWPGPLTLVLKKKSIVPKIVNAGLDTVAIRMPSHEIALSLIKESKNPIAAPSANISTRPSPTSAEHVINDLYGRIDAIIDGGETNIGVESTVIDLTTTPIKLLRPGGVTLEDLQKILGKNKIRKLKFKPKEKTTIPKSPGMKYRHYSPKADVFLVEGDPLNIEQKVQEIATNHRNEGYKVGIMTIKQKYRYRADLIEFIGRDFETIAKNIFRMFRKFDKENMDIIIIEGIKEKRLGLAVMNRLRKAAEDIIRV